VTYTLHSPESLDEAVEVLAGLDGDIHVMAGGISLTLLVKQGLIRPDHVLSLHRVPELRRIADEDHVLRIGAMATLSEVERSDVVQTSTPVLSEAVRRVASVRIRNQATLGGNLAHADPAQDPPVVLLALDARVITTSRRGQREIPIQQLFTDTFTTSLEPGEILTRIEISPMPPGSFAAYRKFLPHSVDDYATVSVAAIRFPDGRINVALGGVAPTPVRALAVERALSQGALPAEAAQLVDGEIEPLSDVRGSSSYKRRMAKVWTERAIEAVRAA
jgi:carbon-monoxide dehydrogenase medium subunit